MYSPCSKTPPCQETHHNHMHSIGTSRHHNNTVSAACADTPLPKLGPISAHRHRRTLSSELAMTPRRAPESPMGSVSPSMGSPAAENRPKPWPGVILYGRSAPLVIDCLLSYIVVQLLVCITASFSLRNYASIGFARFKWGCPLGHHTAQEVGVFCVGWLIDDARRKARTSADLGTSCTAWSFSLKFSRFGCSSRFV